METPPAPVEVFCSFAEADVLYLEQLEKHLSLLQREGLITIWHKRLVVAGSNWQVEVDQRLNAAALILLLISPSYAASDDCYDEMQRAMQRLERGEAQVIPLLLRPVDWQCASFGKLTAAYTKIEPRDKMNSCEQILKI
jgi:internalin A